MSDLNLCQFIGRLGGGPEIRYTPSGVAVANFTIAVSEKYKSKSGEQVENTEWIRCTAWRRLAEIIGEYLSKGKQVYVSGKWKTRKWDDKDGNTRYTTELQVDQMQMLGGHKDQNEQHGTDGDTHDGQTPNEDDIPF